MKKKIGIALAALVCMFVLPMLAGCRANPWSAQWQLYYYVKDGVKYSTSFNEMDYFATVPPDAVNISFTEDGNFEFTDCNGEYFLGKYTTKDGDDSTTVKLRFASGETAEGWCSQSGGWVSRIRRDACFNIGGVKYYFDDGYYHRTTLESGLSDVAHRLEVFENSTAASYVQGFYRSKVESENGERFLTIQSDDGEYFRFNLSRTKESGKPYYRYTVYEFDREYTISETTLREGVCAVRYDESSERFAIHFRTADWEEQA